MRRTLTRRDALHALGAAAAAPSLARCAPTEDRATLEDWELIRSRIDTIVVVMMENRSFDHYLGALRLIEGRVDVDGLDASMFNPHPDGHDEPVRPATIDCVADPPHSWTGSHNQFADGTNSGFVIEYAEEVGPELAGEVMGYWDRLMLPTYYGFADHYTTCDQWFSALMTSTWPNRFYALCAQNDGVTGNDLPTTEYPSIFTRLSEAGVSWGAYYANLPWAVLLPDVGPEPNFSPIEAFFEQAAEGTLPRVCWVEPQYGRNDDHPPEHPLAGQVFVQSIYQALAASPQWDRTLFIVMYDEHGGFFDHVPPGTAPDAHAAEGFDQRGFRVPALVVGPWVKTGHVSHVPYDHTSWLAFVEHLFDLAPLTERDAAADPMTDVLDLTRMRDGVPSLPLPFPPIEADDAILYRTECNPIEQLFGTTGLGDLLQPELEAYANVLLAGSPLDRRAQSDRVYAWLLAWAEANGVLRRAKVPG